MFCGLHIFTISELFFAVLCIAVEFESLVLFIFSNSLIFGLIKVASGLVVTAISICSFSSFCPFSSFWSFSTWPSPKSVCSSPSPWFPFLALLEFLTFSIFSTPSFIFAFSLAVAWSAVMFFKFPSLLSITPWSVSFSDSSPLSL